MKEKLLSLLDSRRAVYFIIIMTIIVQTGFLFYCNWRWHNITVDGIAYQMHCVPRLETESFHLVVSSGKTTRI